MARTDVEATDLSEEEVMQALNQARRFKNFNHEDWQEARKDILLKMFDLIKEDADFTKKIIEHIKRNQPRLLKEI